MVFFFNDTATTEIYTLSLHDALPIYDIGGALVTVHDVRTGELLASGKTSGGSGVPDLMRLCVTRAEVLTVEGASVDRKSTRLNSSHANISYAVFCLKKKKQSYRT